MTRHAAAALGALAIALSPRWPAARVWAAAGALAWTAELAFDAADVALRYRTMALSGAGLALVVAASARRSAFAIAVAAVYAIGFFSAARDPDHVVIAYKG